MIQRFEQFTTNITQIYRNLQRIKMEGMSEFDLKGTHVMCLFELNHNREGLTVTQLSQLCSEDKAAISRTISELMRKELVTSDSQKKYRNPLQLTPKGMETADRIDEIIEDAVSAGSNGLSEEELDNFHRILTHISNNLKHYPSPAKN